MHCTYTKCKAEHKHDIVRSYIQLQSIFVHCIDRADVTTCPCILNTSTKKQWAWNYLLSYVPVGPRIRWSPAFACSLTWLLISARGTKSLYLNCSLKSIQRAPSSGTCLQQRKCSGRNEVLSSDNTDGVYMRDCKILKGCHGDSQVSIMSKL